MGGALEAVFLEEHFLVALGAELRGKGVEGAEAGLGTSVGAVAPGRKLSLDFDHVGARSQESGGELLELVRS